MAGFKLGIWIACNVCYLLKPFLIVPNLVPAITLYTNSSTVHKTIKPTEIANVDRAINHKPGIQRWAGGITD